MGDDANRSPLSTRSATAQRELRPPESNKDCFVRRGGLAMTMMLGENKPKPPRGERGGIGKELSPDLGPRS